MSYENSKIGQRFKGYYLTAYGIAVKHGFVGTEEEWLASLIGPQGKTGDPFTYEDFTEEQLLSLVGPPGADGKDGEKGDKGDPFTYEDFTEEQLESLGSGSKERMERAEKRLTNLEHQVAPEYFETDETVAYEKVVPTNACPYAELQSVGGMTHNGESNNLIPFPYKDVSGKEIRGVTFTYDDKGVITINGTIASGSETIRFYLSDHITLPAGTYTLSGSDGTNLGISFFARTTNYSVVFDGHQTKTLTNEETLTECYLQVDGIRIGQTIDNFEFRLMLNVGSEALPFEPYSKEFEGFVDTPVTSIVSKDADGNILSSIDIPEAVRALDGYGKGIELCSNEVDLSRSNFIRKVRAIELTGSEKWSAYGSYYGVYSFDITDRRKSYSLMTSVCSHFKNILHTVYVSPNTANVGEYSDHDNKNHTFFKTAFATVNEWKAYLAEQAAAGTPVTLIYALAEPTEEDISDKLGDIDNLIEVAPGGKIVFENEDGRAVHSSVTYMLEEGTV